MDRVTDGRKTIMYLEVMMKVIQTANQTDHSVMSMQFMNLSNQSRERIMQFCFKKERDQRIKELS